MLKPLAWWMAVERVDLRRGMDGLLATVMRLQHDAYAGAAYVFGNRAGNRIKVVCCDGTGVWLCQRRLHRGRFVWPQVGDEICELSHDEFAWLSAGVDWQRLSANPLTHSMV